VLKQRIITAAWLAPLMLAGLFGLQGGPFALFTALVVLLAGWEWTNLAAIDTPASRLALVAGLAMVMAALWLMGAAMSTWILWLGVAGWLLNLYWVMQYPDKAARWQSSSRRLAMGVWVLLPAWVGLNVLRESGAVWLLFVLLLVWCADIGAYFAGRAFGRHKLAPRVSPGKSWEGVMGGVVATAGLAVVYVLWQGLDATGLVVLMLATLLVTLASVLGDLLESMLKRQRGIKDASNLLPGHGGVLDRIDSLTAALPLFALIYLGLL
jgi:phosphatidate cytidylyltransferase